MATPTGTFVWHELMTTDADAAERFYRDVVGWKTQDSGMAGPRYTLLLAGDTQVGGLMTLSKESRDAGAKPGWIGYVGVGDVDAAAAHVARAGGSVHRKPDDIPGIGRFAAVSDPQGAAFVLFKGIGEAPAPAASEKPGHVGWAELHAGDWERAFSFYADLFGWKKSDAMDMGQMGTYQLFAADTQAIGGMMTKRPEMPAPFWLYYFNVGDIDAAAGRVTAGGGKVLNGPHPVPGGGWVIQGLDPQGAMFALVGTRP